MNPGIALITTSPAALPPYPSCCPTQRCVENSNIAAPCIKPPALPTHIVVNRFIVAFSCRILLLFHPCTRLSGTGTDDFGNPASGMQRSSRIPHVPLSAGWPAGDCFEQLAHPVSSNPGGAHRGAGTRLPGAAGRALSTQVRSDLTSHAQRMQLWFYTCALPT